MNGTLEGRYRQLLAIYPAEHRRKHQDEMLGVLMTGARAGQRWPGRAESADLIRVPCGSGSVRHTTTPARAGLTPSR